MLPWLVGEPSNIFQPGDCEGLVVGMGAEIVVCPVEHGLPVCPVAMPCSAKGLVDGLAGGIGCYDLPGSRIEAVGRQDGTFLPFWHEFFQELLVEVEMQMPGFAALLHLAGGRFGVESGR